MNYKEKLSLFFHNLTDFIRFVTRHFINDDCPYRAAALAFTTLFAIVPLMTIGLVVLSSFPVFQGLSDPLQNFIFKNFVPATGQIIQNYLQKFAAQVPQLSIWGISFLFISALLVMFTIEHSMNKIWRVTTPRQGVTAFILYWTILSLAPVFLGLSLAATSYLLSIPFIKENSSPSFFLNSAPYFLSLIGLTFLYVVVPNHSVKLRHGLLGGLIATLLFESAKHGFVYYLSLYDTYQLLYGAFAIVPIFFIWVYWVWMIILLGAEISYALSVDYRRRRGKPIPGFIHALLWLKQLWLAQQKGAGLTLTELVNSTKQPYKIDIELMLAQLIQMDLIHLTANNQYRLSIDINNLTLYQLAQKLPYPLPKLADFALLQDNAQKTEPYLFANDEAFLKTVLFRPLNQLLSTTIPISLSTL